MEVQKKKINIGFDIGTTSVGWSIIDDEYNIIDMGVRLFDDPASPDNGKLLGHDRRNARSARRRLRRLKVRKQDYKKLLVKHNIIDSMDSFDSLVNIDITKWNVQNPIELKVKGLSEELTKQQIIFILYHYVQHRGYFHIDSENGDDIEQLTNIDNSNILPSIQILEFYKKNGYYKDSEATKNVYFGKYKNEIQKILEQQKTFHNFISQEFVDEYISLFSRKRDFAIGPGSEKSPSLWGLYRKNNNGEIEKIGNNLWDVTIGKCTYFPNEYRALKNSATSELFNLFNDLNNIYLFNKSDYKLSNQHKQYIFNEINKRWITEGKDKKVNLKIIIEAFNNNKPNPETPDLTNDDIFGYRVNKKHEPVFTELKNYKTGFIWLRKYNQDIKEILSLETLNLVDQLINCLAKHSNDDIKKKQELKNSYDNYDDNEYIQLIKDIKGLTSTHSLSEKAMRLYLDFCFKNLDYSKNQMNFFSEYFRNNQNNSENKPKTKYLPTGQFDNAIISPTARRAFNENIKVMNRIIKIYSKKYEISNITFELPRDKNSHDESSKIRKIQQENEDKVNNILKSNGFNKDIKEISGIAQTRLKLWKEQDEIDIYTGSNIEFDVALSGKGLEIDHIIPYQISGDNSISNKVLVKSKENADKGNLTPYQYFAKIGKLKEYLDRVNKYFPDKSKKRSNLLYALDPMKDVGGFIERNLVDTRYASRLILNTFQDFFKGNPHYNNVKIKVINGSLTNFARYNILTSNNKIILHKDRDLYCHHAIDASIVCFLGMNYTIKQAAQWVSNNLRGYNSKLKVSENGLIYDDSTGEILESNKPKQFDIAKWCEKSEEISKFALELSQYNDEWDSENNKINFATKHVKFSRKITHKNNIELSNETIWQLSNYCVKAVKGEFF